MAEPTQIKISREGTAMIITLNRPEAMNAFTAVMKDEMIAALDEADNDDSIRAVIVTGQGERAFCAGADLSAGAETFDYDKRVDSDSPVGPDGSINWSHDLVRDSGGELSLRIFAAKKPIVAS